jgi:hypothetical protein
MSEQDRGQTMTTAAGADMDGHPATDDIARGGAREGRDLSGNGATPASSNEPDVSTDRAASTVAPTAASEGERTPLFPAGQSQELRSRWESIQVGFVDEPRAAVEQADSLVAEVMQTLATTFSRERSGLEGQWSKGEDVSTEDLRQTLRRYRSFFDRLLSL